MSTNPFDLIKQGVAGLINQGKSFLSAPDNSTAGIIRNTITGIPAAAQGVVKSAQDTFAPTYNYTREELAKVSPFPTVKVVNKKPVITPGVTYSPAETLGAIGKVGSEFATGLGRLGAAGIDKLQSIGTDVVPGYKELTDKIVQTKTGGLLADVIPKLEKYQQPSDVRQAGLMSGINLFSNVLPVGSIKDIGVASKIIAGTKDIGTISKELKALGLSEEAIKNYAPRLIDVTDPKEAAALITEAHIPPEVQQRAVELQLRKEALDSSPLNGIDKRTVMRQGSARELGDVKNPTVSRKIEDAIAQAGVTDPTEFAQKLDEHAAAKAQLAADQKALKNDITTYRDNAYVGNKVTLSSGVEKHTFTSPAVQEFVSKIDKRIPSPSYISKASPEELAKIRDDMQALRSEVGKMETPSFFDRNIGTPTQVAAGEKLDVLALKKLRSNIEGVINRAEDQASSKLWNEHGIPEGVYPKGSPLKTLTETKPPLSEVPKESPLSPVLEKKNIPPVVGTGEARSLEETALQQAQRAGVEADPIASSLDNIVKKDVTDINKRVGIVEAVRTPENVFKKMGLSNEFNKIRTAHEGYVKELPKNIDKITQWSKEVPKGSNERIFKYLDGKAIDLTPQETKVASEIKTWLSEWADRLGLPHDERIANYITHLFDSQLIKKEFDEDLAKIIADRVPGSVYNPFLEKRLGAKGYKEDTWAALDAYAKRATRKVYMDPALADLSNASKTLEKSQYDYVKKFADKVNMRPSTLDTAVDNTIKQLIGYRLGQRPVAAISKLLRQMTFRGMLGANLGSALKNLTQGLNTYAKLGEKYTIIGYAKLAREGVQELKDLGILSDNFVTDRALSATKKAVEKLDKTLFAFFDTAEKINRGAAFYGAKAKALAEGKTLQEAIEYGKKIVRDTQFQYSAIDTPIALQNDLVKVIAQFLTYPIKQTEFLAGMAKNKEYMGILRYIIGSFAVSYTLGNVIGMKPKDFIPFAGYLSGEQKFGTPPSLKFPVEVAKAALNTPDKYGQPRDLAKKGADIGNTMWGMIPGGIQAKNTLSGLGTILNGGSYTDTGKKRFEAPQGLYEQSRALLFGQYNTEAGQKYIAGGFATQNVPKTEAALKQEIKDKLKSGEFGSIDVAKEYAQKELEKIRTTEKNNRLNLPEAEYKAELKRLIQSGSLTMADAEEEATLYQKQEKAPAPERSKLGLVSDYAKAFFTDPENAWKALVTPEKLGNVKGNLVELQRFYGLKFDAAGGSEAKRRELMAKEGIPWSEKENYNLEHIVPVSAGGDNSDSNLMIASRPLHDFFTPIDIALGNAAKNGKISRTKASELAKKFKVEKSITAEDVIKLINE